MPAFHIVVKLLMLRLLLANLSGLSGLMCFGYDFGYHPSAEEFDSLLRETRTWTRNHLKANEHRRHYQESYVPRYQYAPKSELDFQLFDDDPDSDQVQLEHQPYVYETVPALETVQSQLIEIADKPEITEGGNVNVNGNGNVNVNVNEIENGNNVSFPIFFTNPATGIVYVISEVGRNTKSQPWLNSGNDNETISIYVTKEQYDADLQALRLKYEQQCALTQSQTQFQSQSQFPSQFQSQSVLSSPGLRPTVLTTARPQIIRLQKPKKTSTTVPGNNKLPPHKPPPVMVTSSAFGTISDQLKLPTTTTTTTVPPRRKPNKTPKPKRIKRKKKKKTTKRRPGHKIPTTTTTTGPQIVLGKRTTNRPPTSTTNLATQLEKPSQKPMATVAGTIFNEQPFVVSTGYFEVPQHLKRRSWDPEIKEESTEARSMKSYRIKRSLNAETTGERPIESENSRRSKDMDIAEVGPIEVISSGASSMGYANAERSLNAETTGERPISSGNLRLSKDMDIAEVGPIEERSSGASSMVYANAERSLNAEITGASPISSENLRQSKDMLIIGVRPTGVGSLGASSMVYANAERSLNTETSKIGTISSENLRRSKDMDIAGARTIEVRSTGASTIENSNAKRSLSEETPGARPTRINSKKSSIDAKIAEAVPILSIKAESTGARSISSLKTGPAGARPISSGKPRPKGNNRRRPNSPGPQKANSKVNKHIDKKQQQQVANPPKKEDSGYKIPHAVHLLHSQHNESQEIQKNHKIHESHGSHGSHESHESQERKKIKGRRRSAENDFDLFDLITGDYEDNDDSYYDQLEDKPIKFIKRRKSSEKPAGNKEKEPEENSSSAEEGADFGAMEEDQPNNSTVNITTEISTSEEIEDQLENENEEQESQSSSKQSSSKKRIKRRPISVKKNSDEYDYDEEEEEKDDNDNDDEDDTESGISSFLRMIFYPVQLAMSRIFDGFTQSDDQSVEKPKYPKYPSYTLYHSAHSNNDLAFDENDSEEEEEDDETDNRVDEGNSLGSWFTYLFGIGRRTKKIGSTTATPPVALSAPAPLATPASEPAGWLDSWFGFGKTTTQASSEEDDYDKWFSGWFDATPKPKARRRKTTTSTTSTTTTMPQMPILTIVDPLRNPQNWIGILAHHIVNATGAATSTTTKNPLLQALVTRATSTTTTTTPQPDLPRHINYDKYQIWRLKPQDEAQVRVLEEFKKGEDGNKMQWLKGPSLRGLTDVLVPPKMLVDFQGTLNFEAIAHEVLIFDVGKAISYEQNKDQYLYTTTRRPTKHPVTPPPMTWNKYYDYDDILKYLETMRMRHTQLVELIHIGRSYEGRPLIVVKIESKQTAAAATAAAASSYKRLKNKRRSGQANAVFIEAGSQGVAWIGPASATWMIGELLRLMRANKSDVEHEFIRNTTWYIMPVLNPDGYVYSHEYDRFWKKSRSQHVAKPPGGLLDSAMTWLQQKKAKEKVCYGVDLDRNWLYQWGKRGSSKGPCNEFYAGPAPFSEPETKAVSEFLMEYRTQIKLYISLQAYGQVVSYPVKANSTYNVERMDDFLDVAMVGTDGLRKKGSKSRYKVDSANDLIEQRSGCADAFAAYEIGIPFSYTLQLADNGVHGYLLPSSAIEPTARDAFEIISSMLDYI